MGELLAENTSQVFSFTFDVKKSVPVPTAALPDAIKFTCFAFSLYFILKGKNKTTLRKENIQLETALRFMQWESEAIRTYFLIAFLILLHFSSLS